MDQAQGKKRSYESSELDQHDDQTRYEQGRQVTGNNSAYTPSQEECSESDVDKQRDIKNEQRLEINRQRAKDIRKRKKQMVEVMQKQITFLTIENNKLQAQNEMQRAELTLLHNSMKPRLPNQQSMLQINASRPLGTSDARSNVVNVSDNTGTTTLSDFLQGPVTDVRSLLNPNPISAPSNAGYSIPSHQAPSFAPNIMGSSTSGNGIIGNGLNFPTDESHQINSSLALPTVGSSNNPLQIADMIMGNELRSQNISTEIPTISATDVRRNRLILSLLQGRQMPDSNNHQNWGGRDEDCRF